MNKNKASFWKIKVNDRQSNINFTGLQGYVSTTYQELVDVLGEPEGDFDKSTAHWTLETPDGTVATIYDYKNYITPQDEYDWHIGGHNDRALLLVEFMLSKPVINADQVAWYPYGGGNDQ
jgi:hypothetical protein